MKFFDLGLEDRGLRAELDQAYKRVVDSGWMILRRGGLALEFFPYPDLDPLQSSFGACLRLDELQRFYDAALATGIREAESGMPRLVPPKLQHSGMRIGYLVDPDGSLLHLVQNA